jgi:hypothetical protein
MGRGKGTNNQRRGRHERLPPAESAEEISSSLSSLSIDSNAKSFPIPLAMWVCQSLANLPKNRTSITATPNAVVARNFQERES